MFKKLLSRGALSEQGKNAQDLAEYLTIAGIVVAIVIAVGAILYIIFINKANQIQ